MGPEPCLLSTRCLDFAAIKGELDGLGPARVGVELLAERSGGPFVVASGLLSHVVIFPGPPGRTLAAQVGEMVLRIDESRLARAQLEVYADAGACWRVLWLELSNGVAIEIEEMEGREHSG